jgi:hypothetical protein
MCHGSMPAPPGTACPALTHNSKTQSLLSQPHYLCAVDEPCPQVDDNDVLYQELGSEGISTIQNNAGTSFVPSFASGSTTLPRIRPLPPTCQLEGGKEVEDMFLDKRYRLE